MTLSLSPFVRPLFFLLVSLKFFLVLKSLNGVSRQIKEYLKFNGSFKGVSKVLRVFQGGFKDILRVFQGSFKSVSRKFKGCLKFKDVSKKFSGCLQKTSRKF